jgi:hypothetical protein
MLTLLEEVRLKGTLMPFEQYRESYLSEQRASISSLRNEEWHLSRSLRLKVQEDGRYRPFCGDTVIFPLHSAEITNLEKLERQLHERIPESLAEPLVPEQMHLTLHDLSNGPSADDIGERLLSNERQCQRIFGELAAHLANRPEDAHIRLVSALAFPCAGISVVLAFPPATEKDHRLIMNAYNLFDEVVYLDYWLRIHVTLAYFRPGIFDLERRAALEGWLQSAQPQIELNLDLRQLQYCRFQNMNDYRPRFTVADFAPQR